jgi:IS30 family transposase
LSVAEREEISRALRSGASCQVIAVRFDRAESTISRDVLDERAPPNPSRAYARFAATLAECVAYDNAMA